MKKKDFALSAFGMRVREIRQEREWTIAKLASALALEPYEIAQVESGLSKVKKEYLTKLFNCLELDTGDRAQLVKLAYGRNNKEARAFYREREEIHVRSARAVENFHKWGPAAFSRLREYVNDEEDVSVANG